MQILESSMLGLRAARHVLTNSATSTTVTLFPMVHVGEAAFYAQVYDDAFDHDVVLVEGVRSPVVRHLTSSYRWIDVEKLGLVIQPRALSNESERTRVVHADLSIDEFHAEWSKVPLWIRAAAFALAPLIGLHRRWFASRESLAEKMTMEDRLSSEDILSWDPEFAAFTHSIMGARDARLLERLGEELDRPPASEGCRIAVIYGASHMRAVLIDLKARGFSPAKGEWLTVFSL